VAISCQIRFQPARLDSERLSFKNNCVKSNKHRPMLSAAEMFFRCYIFVSFGNNVDIVVHYDNNPFWISADTNKDDLEWPWTSDSS